MFGSDLSQLRHWTYSSSQAVSGCTAASLFDFKGRGFWAEKALHWEKLKEKEDDTFVLSAFVISVSSFSVNIEQEKEAMSG